MSCSVAVSFCPIRKERYEDSIEFSVAALATEGAGWASFTIPVRAALPQAALAAPDAVDFGFCACRELAERPLTLSNAGEVAIEYEWEVDAPFTVEPTRGSLAPGESAALTATFMPSDASVHVATATCVVAGLPNVSCSMHIKGIGKYPYLSLAGAEADFGEVLVGQVAEREVRLTNVGLVPASYSAVRRDGDAGGASSAPASDCFFSLSPATGTLLPGECAPLRVSYAPKSAGTYSCEQFMLRTAGACTTSALSVSGTAVGPSVSLTPSVLDFGDVRAGDHASKVLHVHNNNRDSPATFQLALPGQGVFRLSKSTGFGKGQFSSPGSGVLPPGGSAHVTVTFAPGSPANFMQTHHALVRDSGEVLKVALMGTCFSDAVRPPPFNAGDVAAHAAATGTINKLAEEPSWAEYFAAGTEDDAPVRLDVSDLEFGGADPMGAGDHRELRVTNTTGAKITVQWTRVDGGTAASTSKTHELPESQRAFVVHPEEADVKSGGSATFRVAFRPRSSGCYYAQTLECTAYVKTMRNFRLVAEGAFVPPWHAAVHCTGHTFTAGAGEAFTPKAAFVPTRVHFTPSEVGKAAYQVVQLNNAGDTPVRYEVQDAALGRAFTARPRKGVIPARGFQLIALRFKAGAPCHISERAAVVLNNSSAINLPLHGAAHKPTLDIEGIIANSLSFKPTCVGAVSRREVTLHNKSRTPVEFAWTVPPRLAESVSVEPSSGTMRGNERHPVRITYSPRRHKPLTGKITCEVAAVGASVVSDSLSVSVHGKATVGAITVEPSSVDLGALFVGQQYQAPITLLNQSDGNMQYRLVAVDEEKGGEAADVTFDAPAGALPARAFKSVVVSVKCAERKRVKYSLRCISSTERTSASAIDAAEGEGAELPPAVTLQGNAAYPTAHVTEVFCRGVAAADLWRQLAITRVNAELSCDLSEAEVSLNKHSFTVSADMAMSALDGAGLSLPFDLGWGTEGDEPTVVRVAFTNRSAGLVANWSLHLRGDREQENENWVDVGEAETEDDRRQDFIIENGIIEVSPRRGSLAPGATVTVDFTYRHSIAGVHEIPMLLCFQRGKRVRLNTVGRTLPLDTSRLLTPSPDTPLLPVPLGEDEPPAQLLPLRNVGSAPLAYSIDTAALDALQAENHGFRVLELLEGAKGVLEPGATDHVKVRFQPLEAHRYEVTLPVSVATVSEGDGGDEGDAFDDYEATLSLVAEGYIPERDAHGHPGTEPSAPPAGCAAPLPKSEWQCFTPMQTLEVEGQRARLSTTVAAFGPVCAHGRSYRVVKVTNTSSAPLAFQWDLTSARRLAADIRVSPMQGTLAGGASSTCEVTLSASMPEVFEVQAACVFTHVGELQRNDNGSVGRTSRRTSDASAMGIDGGHDGGEHTSDAFSSDGDVTDGECEEVLAIDAPYQRPPRVLGPRLSVVECGTESMVRRYPSLRMRTATSMATRAQSGGVPPTADSEGMSFFADESLSTTGHAGAEPLVLLLGIEASVLSASHFRSLMGAAMTPQLQPQAASRLTPLAAALGRDTETTADESAFVAAMLKRMVGGVLVSDAVREALADPPRHTVPAYESITSWERPGGVPEDAESAEVIAKRQAEANAAADAAVMAMPEFQEFAEYVLEGALMSLCRDGALTSDL